MPVVHPRRLRAIACFATAAVALCTGAAARAAEPAADPHAHHRAMLSGSSVRTSHGAYAVPDVTLVDEAGRKVQARALLDGKEPVALNFIYTSCTTICPVMTATMLELQRSLRGGSKTPHFVSISIDPEFDSAPVLSRYAQRYGAKWTFLTGTPQDVRAVLDSFDANRGGKANHAALTLFRHAGAPHWLRVEGLASATELAQAWQSAP